MKDSHLKPPISVAPNLEWAKYYHSLGLTPLPVKPGTKRPLVVWEPYQKRQSTLAEIEGWDWRGGIGVVTTGLIVVDCDRGGEQLTGDRAFPVSWSVKTGSGGFHRYYKGNGQPTRNAVGILKGDNGAQVDIRADGGFIVVPPSTHIQTGRPYRWIISPADTPLAQAPAWIQEAVLEKKQHRLDPGQQPAWVTELLQGVPQGQRDDSGTRLAGYFLNKGIPEDVVVELLIPFAEKCAPPLSRRDTEKIVDSIARTHSRRGGVIAAAEAQPTSSEAARVEPIVGGGAEACEGADADAPDDAEIVFPEDAYMGLASEISYELGSHLEAPRQFFYIDYLTFLGAAISPHVSLNMGLREETRLYTIKVGPTWASRKSSAQEKSEDLFSELHKTGDLDYCYGAGSAEGLEKILNGDTPVILLLDEFKAFVDKCSIQNSVLLPMVTTLFHRNVYQNATKTQNIKVENGRLAMSGACTTDTFKTMFNPTFRNLGALNRLFIVTGQRKQSRPFPHPIPTDLWEAWRSKTLRQVRAVQGHGRVLSLSQEAMNLWEDWYNAMPNSHYAARLDTYGFRFMQILAITAGHAQIDKDVIASVIALLDYQFRVRQELDPLDADNAIARLEEGILRNLAKGAMWDSRLRTYLHIEKGGEWRYRTAWGNLSAAGWVDTKSQGKGVRRWLTESGKLEVQRRAKQQ